MFPVRLVPLLILVLLIALPAVALSPGIALTITEVDLGSWYFVWWSESAQITVARGEPLEFSWTAAPEIPDDTTLLGFRYGWDVADVGDPQDPGWVQMGLEDVSSAPARSFLEGQHSFSVYVEDDIGRVTIGTVLLNIDQSIPTGTCSVGQLKAAHR